MRLIDAERLLWELSQDAFPQDGSYGRGRYSVIEAIRNAPPAEPKRGKWMSHPTEREWDVCDNCGTGCKRREYGENEDGSEWVVEYNYLYCPNCGAKMDKE